MVEFLSNLPHVCDLERPTGTGDWLVFKKGKKIKRMSVIMSMSCMEWGWDYAIQMDFGMGNEAVDI